MIKRKNSTPDPNSTKKLILFDEDKPEEKNDRDLVNHYSMHKEDNGNIFFHYHQPDPDDIKKEIEDTNNLLRQFNANNGTTVGELLLDKINKNTYYKPTYIKSLKKEKEKEETNRLCALVRQNHNTRVMD